MSVKYFDEKEKRWRIFPGTIGAPGKDAYTIACENGYLGTPEEFYSALASISKLNDDVESILNFVESVDSVPTKDSDNLVKSGGVFGSISDLNTTLSNSINSCKDNCTKAINEEKLRATGVEDELRSANNELSNTIKNLIVDSLESDDSNKALSARQGKIIKNLIDSIYSFKIEVKDELPSEGEEHILYLIKSEESDKNIYNEYLYINNNWELIGNLSADLTNYYTKDEVNSKLGTFKKEVDNKLSESGNGNVNAENDLTSDYIVLGAGDKNVKVSGVSVSDFETKSDLKQTLTQYVTKEDAERTYQHTGDYALKSDIPTDYITKSELSDKQDALVSGLNIKTINGQSLLGEGNIEITSGGTLTVDDSLNNNSENPVQNKAIKEALDNKVDQSVLNNYLTKEEAGNTYQVSGDYVTSDALENLATKEDVENIDAYTKAESDGKYLTSANLNGYATEKWVEDKHYLTEIPENYVTDDELSTTLNDYALKSDVPEPEPSVKYSLGLWKGGTPEYEKEYYNGSEAKEIHYMPSFEYDANPGSYGYSTVYTQRQITDNLAPGQMSIIEYTVPSNGDKLTFSGDNFMFISNFSEIEAEANPGDVIVYCLQKTVSTIYVNAAIYRK